MVIIPCSKEKRWHHAPPAEPARVAPPVGPLPARLAYTSPLHLVAQRYVVATGEPWFILSALHGLLRPDDVVPSDYDVTFSRPNDPVITTHDLAEQAQQLGLTTAGAVLSLCPADYNDRLRAALGATPLLAPLDDIALADLAAMEARVRALMA